MGLCNMRGDVAAYLRLLRQFDTTHRDDMRKLGEDLADGRGDEARDLAHTLKGAAGTLGLTRLQAAAGALEKNLRSLSAKGGDKQIPHLIETLSAEQNHLHEALALIAAERNRQFDPDVTDAFLAEFDEFVAIARKYQAGAEAILLKQ